MPQTRLSGAFDGEFGVLQGHLMLAGRFLFGAGDLLVALLCHDDVVDGDAF